MVPIASLIVLKARKPGFAPVSLVWAVLYVDGGIVAGT